MPRMPRVVVPGLPLHVIQRGNNRQEIFNNAMGKQHWNLNGKEEW
jgi:REP element-mobilizing transposase RayT